MKKMKVNMKYISKTLRLFLLVGFTFSLSACLNDLDQSPNRPDFLLDEEFYKNPNSYQQVLARIYAGLAVTGQNGPAGSSDISGIDEGFGQYIRGLWQLQEITTDEAIIAWADGNLPDLHNQTWTPSNEFVNAAYSRFFYQVTISNEFLRQTTDEKLSSRNVGPELREVIRGYRAEARVLRALSYYHLLDMFGNVPVVTEADPVGFFLPQQRDRAFLFNFVESELLAAEGDLADPRSNQYARVDKAVAWTILAKLYLNAEVYINSGRYDDCRTYCERIISSGYQLASAYDHLFLADNNSNGAQNEVIFPIAYDGRFTQTFGGTTYLVHAPVGGEMNPVDFGINGGWNGLRTTSAFVNKFSDITGNTDSRAMFFTNGQSLEIDVVSNFTEGYAIAKWKNVDSQGRPGSDVTGNFPDTDYPMFRLGDIYLMYAEAHLRGGGGSRTDAVQYINLLRQRAYGDNSGNISSNDLTLEFILDERARELHWEGHRRTDLIRFGQFTGGSYIWPWKGGVRNGTATGRFRDLFPIPANELISNTSSKQNPGY